MALDLDAVRITWRVFKDCHLVKISGNRAQTPEPYKIFLSDSSMELEMRTPDLG